MKESIMFVIGVILGAGTVIALVEIAKDDFWRCQPEVHGTGYCFYKTLGH